MCKVNVLQGGYNMAANRPPACQTRAYVEVDYELLQSTGEIRIVSSPIIAPTITTKVPRGKFEITYTAELFDVMKELGNKKIEILSYILDNKDGNNSLNMTNTQLAKATNSSRPTVIETMKILQDAKLIARQNSVIMVSPKLMVKGSQLREAWLMRKYEEITEDTQANIENSIEVEVGTQYELTADGNVVLPARNKK